MLSPNEIYEVQMFRSCFSARPAYCTYDGLWEALVDDVKNPWKGWGFSDMKITMDPNSNGTKFTRNFNFTVAPGQVCRTG